MTALTLPRPLPRVPAAAWGIVGLLVGIAIVLDRGGDPFYDGVAYYAVSPVDPYQWSHGAVVWYGAFWYAPVLAQLLAPFTALPLLVFMAGWTALLVGALAYIGGRRWWLLLGIPYVIVELHAGNIHLLMAAAVVAGFRWPGAWAFLALTKVTPFVGVLWFALRREWRKFGIAAAFTGAVVAVGFVLAPGLWVEWVEVLANASRQGQPGLLGPLLLRLPVALLLLVWAAPRDARWALPIVVLLAMPNIWWHSLSILAASVALHPAWSAQTARTPRTLVVKSSSST